MTEYSEHFLQAQDKLRAAKRALNEEISSYPTPISGCDAQFNHLLGQRRRINAALAALDQPVFIPTPRTPDATAGVESR